MRTLWGIILGGLALVGTAEARLEESLDKLKARYGEPIYADKEEDTYLFEKSGILMRFNLKNDKAFMVEIWQP